MAKQDLRFILLFVVVISALVAVPAALLTRGSGGEVESLDSGYRQIMGTFARVVSVHDDQQVNARAIDAAFEQMRRIEQLMSVHEPNSQLSQLNRTGHRQPAAVDRAVFELVQKSLEISRLSGGAFDITAGPVITLWQQADKHGRAPAEHQIRQALAKVGSDKILLDGDNSTIAFAVEGVKLDLGGIAKGYSVDLAIEAMRREGVKGAMVDLGGDIRCFGVAGQGRQNWQIGLQDPSLAQAHKPNTNALIVLSLEEAAITTSGHYHRFIELEGRRHSHIVDTRTGKSATGPASTTIIAADTATADALATAVAVLGKTKGLELIESLDGVEAILIDTHNPDWLITTSGAGRYIRR